MNFSKKICTLNSENVAQNFVRLAEHFLPATYCFDEREILCDLRNISFPQLFVSMSAKYFQLKALKTMEIFSVEQMRRGPKKMK